MLFILSKELYFRNTENLEYEVSEDLSPKLPQKGENIVYAVVIFQFLYRFNFAGRHRLRRKEKNQPINLSQTKNR